MAAAALIFAACNGDSGNNSTEPQGNSSSSTGISSSCEQINSSSVVKSSSSSVKGSSSSVVVSSSGAKAQSSSSIPVSSSVGTHSSSSLVVSSSSVNVQSSSSVPSSSSAVAPSSVEHDSITYAGQTYRTVKIGTQTWMAENLNYADSIATPNLAGNSWCYKNSADNCAKYGRLYTWTGAMDIDDSNLSARTSAVISGPWQGVCPAGWHVPTAAEWTTLENAVGGRSTAGTALKSTSGWKRNGNGRDVYGFSALPGGIYGEMVFYNSGSSGFWWTATEYRSTGEYTAYIFYDMSYDITSMTSGHSDEVYSRSLRCLKD